MRGEKHIKCYPLLDWKDKETGEQDGLADHTGIVEYTDLQNLCPFTAVKPIIALIGGVAK